MTDNAQLPESPFLVERLLRVASLQSEKRDFETEDDFRAAVQSLLDDGLEEKRLRALQDDPAELAQELAYQAYESEDGDKALEICEQALSVDPRCVDALTIKALMTSEDAGHLITDLQWAATCAEDALGEDYFDDADGSFWSLVTARPYLRTLKQLAEVLWSVGRRFDAVDVYETMVRLDPEDHSGHAALLLSCYLSMGEVQRSWDLLELLDDDESALYLWSWVLVDLMAMDTEAARESLDRAIDANPHVILYLFDLVEAEPEVSPYVQAGSEAEARVCARILSDPWYRNPDAMVWLQQALVELGLLEPMGDDDEMEFTEEEEPETEH